MQAPTTDRMADLSPMINFGGLASGLDTNTIVDQLMAIERQPETRIKTQQSQAQQRKTDLQAIEDSLKSLQFAAQDLKSPTLWLDTQSVDVNDSTKLVASRTGGAGTGGYQVIVTQLASASQHWFTYSTPPAADTSITIDGHDITIAAGSDVTAAANTINADAGSPVYASVVTAANGTQYLALSSKTTGSTSDFVVTDQSGLLTEDTSRAVAGVNAQGSVGGVAFDETSNVIADAIPGVSLTLKGVTGPSSPVTVTVGSPAPDYNAIAAKMKAFVEQYNATVTLIRGKLAEAPVVNPTTTADQLKGDLYGDSMLTGLLGELRTTVYDTFATGNSQLDEMAEIGVSTGGAVGSGTLNQDSIDGKLTFDQAKFMAAIQSDPQSVRKLIGGDSSVSGFAQAIDGLLQPTVGADGTLDQSIASADSDYRELADQLVEMDSRLAQKQDMLKKQFADMEAAMQQSQAAAAAVSGQLTALQA